MTSVCAYAVLLLHLFSLLYQKLKELVSWIKDAKNKGKTAKTSKIRKKTNIQELRINDKGDKKKHGMSEKTDSGKKLKTRVKTRKVIKVNPKKKEETEGEKTMDLSLNASIQDS